MAQMILLARNENSFGCSPRVSLALENFNAIHRYPPDSEALIVRLAQFHCVLKASVLLGHGSNDVARMIFRTLLSPGDEVVVAHPTFTFYSRELQLQGITVKHVGLREGCHDLEAMQAAVNPKTKLVLIVDPNNPTGAAILPAQFENFLTHLPPQVVLLVDQAYYEYLPSGYLQALDYLQVRPGLIVLRTFSKIYGLAGLRIGYAVGDPKIIQKIQRQSLPFAVSSLALVAAEAALEDQHFICQSRERNAQHRAFLSEGLAKLGLFVYPSHANFIALRVPDSATEVYQSLQNYGVLVRNGDEIDLSGFLRVTVGRPAENQYFLKALSCILADLN
jgi:histidinol-phosphate aminotransferase